MIPSTVERVPQHTAEHVNQEIRRQTEERSSKKYKPAQFCCSGALTQPREIVY
jgi:hypothetical protein